MYPFINDLRHSVRLLRRSPGFATVATIILALGIGANCAIFSIVNELLLRPLPYKEPERIVALWDRHFQMPKDAKEMVTFLNFQDWRAQNQVFEEMAAMAIGDLNFSGAGDPKRVSGLSVTIGYFKVLGMQPILGRTFLEEECASDAHPAVILNYGFWQKHLGGRLDAIGQTIRLDSQPHTVVGVMPPECSGLFTFMGYKYAPDLWTPLTPKPWQALRGNHSWFAIARIKPGISLERAQSDMDIIVRRLEQQYPEANKGWSVVVSNLQESLFGATRPALLALLGAVVFVLLIACINVANLLLVRASGRAREMAIRTALGAGRGRLLRQMLAESLLLSLLGGAAGLLLAVWSIDLINGFILEHRFAMATIQSNVSVLLFAVLMAFLTAILVGILPALRASRFDINQNLKAGSRGDSAGHGRNRLSRILVVGEVMLSLALLIGAGLLIQSYIHLWRVNLGFRPERVLTMSLALSTARYPEPSQWTSYYRQVLDRASALPGVQSAGITGRVPLAGAQGTSYTIEGEPQLKPENWHKAGYLKISPQYFATMSIPLLKGRFFTDQDTADSPKVAIISASLARERWGDQEPLSRQLIHGASGKLERYTVVGVASDLRQDGLEQGYRPTIYLPYTQVQDFYMNLVVRTQAAPSGMVAALQKELKAIDPDQPAYDVRTMEKNLSLYLAERRLVLVLMGIFAALALLLALIGIYGVISYSVAQRTREIGIRMALGARKSDVLRMVLGQGVVLILVGVGLGVIIALAGTKVLASLLYGITPTDPWTFAGLSVLLLAVSLAACFLPAYRAARINPIMALRWE